MKQRSGLPRPVRTEMVLIEPGTVAVITLDDGRRVLSRRSLLTVLGRFYNAGKGRLRDPDGLLIPPFLSARNLEPYLSPHLLVDLAPIYFVAGGVKATGYKAAMLPRICKIFVTAEAAGVLHALQQPVARRCASILAHFGVHGLEAVHDEQAAYRSAGTRDTLAAKLSQITTHELSEWAKFLPDQFYRELFRLRRWEYADTSTDRPRLAARFINDLVFQRLSPLVVAELSEQLPQEGISVRKRMGEVWTLEDIPHAGLGAHLKLLIELMQAAPSWASFHRVVQRALPARNGDRPA